MSKKRVSAELCDSCGHLAMRKGKCYYCGNTISDD